MEQNIALTDKKKLRIQINGKFNNIGYWWGKPGGNRPLRRPRRMWVDNIKMDLREIGWDDMDWINLDQDREQWRALVITVMNLQVP
jgi:hypothetical protein